MSDVHVMILLCLLTRRQGEGAEVTLRRWWRLRGFLWVEWTRHGLQSAIRKCALSSFYLPWQQAVGPDWKGENSLETGGKNHSTTLY